MIIDELLENAVNYIMKKNALENINQFIHLDPLNLKEENKILPSKKYIMEKSKLYFIPGTVVTMDERMISYRGPSQEDAFEISKL